MTVIDEATGADVGQIHAVLTQAYAPFVADFSPTALRQTEHSIAAELSKWLLARREAMVASVVMHYPEPPEYTFCFLATRPDMQGYGLGSALVDAVLQRARLDGHRQVTIVLRASLTRNVEFFRRRGFSFVAPFGTGAHNLYQREVGG